MLDTLLLDSLESAKDRFHFFNLLGETSDSLLLYFDFELKLILLENLGLHLRGHLSLDHSCLFNFLVGLLGRCLILNHSFLIFL